MLQALTFVEFCEELGIALEPGQRVYALVAFDGVHPKDLATEEERGIARDLFGPDVLEVPREALAVIVAVVGARSGKSYLGAIRVLHLAMTVDVDHIAAGQQAVALILAPKLETASETLDYIKGIVREHRKLRQLCRGVTDTSRQIRIRRSKRWVKIVVNAATAGGIAGRGRWFVAAFVDEAAFLRDKKYKVNDQAIFDAIRPRLLPGAQLLLKSTPMAKSGLLWARYAANWNKPATSLAVHASTATMRSETTPTGAAVWASMRAAYRDDEENARREYGAEFLDIDDAQFFDEATLDGAIDKTIKLGARPEPANDVFFGADLAFARNSSAAVALHRSGGVTRLADILEERPRDGKPLKPSVVCAHIAAFVQNHLVDGAGVPRAERMRRDGRVYGDRHYLESAREHLAEAGLTMCDVYASNDKLAPADNETLFTRARILMREGKLKVPNHPRLLAQLRSVLARPANRGGSAGVSITIPQAADGSHGDLVSALVFAVWPVAGIKTPAKPPPQTAEAAALEAERARVAKIGRDQQHRQKRRASGW